MRAATSADLPNVIAYLKRHIEGSMFPLSNLLEIGLALGRRGEPARAMRFLLAETNGEIAGLLGISAEGMLFPQAPVHELERLAKGVSGPVTGWAGPGDQVRALTSVLGIATDAAAPPDIQYGLDLKDLKCPAMGGLRLAPLSQMGRTEAVFWRTAFLIEALGTPSAEAAQLAASEIDGYLKRNSHRVLMDMTEPLSMNGFNASLGGVVQIGSVYTPLGLRGRGYARRALGALLAEARAAGARRAILSTGNRSASRAYQALGFQEIGTFAIHRFPVPEVLTHG